MTRWIRWPGLIAFLVIVGGTAAFFLLFAGPLIRCAIERSGTAPYMEYSTMGKASR